MKIIVKIESLYYQILCVKLQLHRFLNQIEIGGRSHHLLQFLYVALFHEKNLLNKKVGWQVATHIGQEYVIGTAPK